MKKTYWNEFVHRGLIACGFGPVVLAIVYLMMQHSGLLFTLTVNEVCTGIFSLAVLSFLAGGMNVIYQIERLPLMVAIFIHGIVLYLGYLVTYLVNNWLASGMIPILVFTGIFIAGYLVIWAIIYSITRHHTQKMNDILTKKRLVETKK